MIFGVQYDFGEKRGTRKTPYPLLSPLKNRIRNQVAKVSGVSSPDGVISPPSAFLMSSSLLLSVTMPPRLSRGDHWGIIAQRETCVRLHSKDDIRLSLSPEGKSRLGFFWSTW